MADRCCPNCNAVLVRKQKESHAKFLVRRHCSLICAGPEIAARMTAYCASKAPVVRETKPCAHCGKAIVRPPNYGVQNWRKRRYCTLTCTALGRRASFFHMGKKTVYRVGTAIVTVQPPREGAKFETPEEWLAHHKPTICPPRYAAPIIGAGVLP